MELRDLKERLKAKKAVSLPLVFAGTDVDFLIDEYLEAIADNAGLEIREVDSLAGVEDAESSVFYEGGILFVYRAGKGEVIQLDRLAESPLIVICDKAPNDCRAEVVEFAKLEPWMVEDYAASQLPGLNEIETKWICKICDYQPYRVKLECEKINVFAPADQQRIFELINGEHGYSDLSDYKIYDISNALVKRDVLALKRAMADIDVIDVEATGLVTIMIKQFTNTINIQMNRSATASSLGMSERQFRAIKYNCGIYSDDELIDRYEFLNSFDRKLKSGYLDLSNKEAVQYIIDNILY